MGVPAGVRQLQWTPCLNKRRLGAGHDQGMSETGLDISHLHEMQKVIPYRRRLDVAARVAASIDHHTAQLAIEKCAAIDRQCAQRLGDLARDGYIPLGQVLDTAQVRDMYGYFSDKPCYAGHVAAKSDGIPRLPRGSAQEHAFGSYLIEDIVLAPHVLELANRPDILALAESYLGCVPTLYSMNAWWSFPQGDEEERVSQVFHRDLDDFKFIALFVYLTDVDEGNGPHQYIRGSHRADIIRDYLVAAGPEGRDVDKILDALFAGAGYQYRDMFAEYLDDRIETFVGPAGSAFITDTYGLHQGVPPTERPRLVCWIRYGLFENHTSREDKITPVPRTFVAGRIPADAKSAYINRLIVGS